MGFFDFLEEIFSSPSQDSNDEEITVNVREYGFEPAADEVILVAHGDCKIMKNGGKEIGEAFGKVHFITEEASSQHLICCVTNKRILIIPQDNKANAKMVFSIGSKVMGVDWATRKIASIIFFNNWLEYSVEFKREEIESAEISLDYPDGTIVIVKFKNNTTLYLRTQEVGHSMGITTSIYQPEIFME
ncbi:MAG: hypothetical protein IJ606_04710 [Bacteroidaceae bacterium]|nr:hypothetical protein [Bacteroidaceae bacterium]